MHHDPPRRRRWPLRTAVLAGATLIALAWPTLAFGHGLVGKQDLPIPGWLVGWAAAAVLVISFVALAVLWPKPRWEHLRERRVAPVPGFLDPLFGLLGVAIYAASLYVAFAGEQTSNDNLFPTLIFAIFWVGIPIASLLFGDVFRAVNPYRAIGRFSGWGIARITRSVPEPLAYPARM